MRGGLLEGIQALQSKRVVLASRSPRRAELLRQVGLTNFVVQPSTFAEDLPKDCSASLYARRTAEAKAREVAKESSDYDLIIGADTVVECGGEVLEKPGDPADAKRMLQLLSDRTHSVHTGLVLITPARDSRSTSEDPFRCSSWTQTTDVTMTRISDRDIDIYTDSGEHEGKAGAYGIQGRAAAWVTRVDGCYNNVVGFPLGLFADKVAQLRADGVL